ncbi:unnamed protein product [Prunus armeniaca]
MAGARRSSLHYLSRLRPMMPFKSNSPEPLLLGDLGDSMTTIGRVHEDAHVRVRMPKIEDKSPTKKSLLNRKLGGLLFVP